MHSFTVFAGLEAGSWHVTRERPTAPNRLRVSL